LHLAIKSAEHFPNTRSIKELLIKGSDRNVKDNLGRKPIDVVRELNIMNGKLRNELENLMVRNLFLKTFLLGKEEKLLCTITC